jgi:hypothetical protein
MVAVGDGVAVAVAATTSVGWRWSVAGAAAPSRKLSAKAREARTISTRHAAIDDSSFGMVLLTTTRAIGTATASGYRARIGAGMGQKSGTISPMVLG